MRRILIATSNSGKLRDFAGAALRHGVEIAGIPDFSSLPTVVEDGLTFEANARKKAEAYSRYAPGEIVVADDSGLEVDALAWSAGRALCPLRRRQSPNEAESNTDDEANNARVLRELKSVPSEQRTGRFVCVLAAARDGKTLATFRGTAEGIILDAPRGTNGFGYDPLFYFPQIRKTFAELTAEEKSKYSHRGAAFRGMFSIGSQSTFSWQLIADARITGQLRFLTSLLSPPDNKKFFYRSRTHKERFVASAASSTAPGVKKERRMESRHCAPDRAYRFSCAACIRSPASFRSARFCLNIF